jgi:hypothetical protein
MAVFLLTVIFGFRISRKEKTAEGKDRYSAWKVWMRVVSLAIPDAFTFALALTAYAFDAIYSLHFNQFIMARLLTKFQPTSQRKATTLMRA